MNRLTWIPDGRDDSGFLRPGIKSTLPHLVSTQSRPASPPPRLSPRPLRLSPWRLPVLRLAPPWPGSTAASWPMSPPAISSWAWASALRRKRPSPDPYWITTTDITNKMYAQCVATGNCAAPSRSSAPRSTPTLSSAIIRLLASRGIWLPTTANGTRARFPPRRSGRRPGGFQCRRSSLG